MSAAGDGPQKDGDEPAENPAKPDRRLFLRRMVALAYVAPVVITYQSTAYAQTSPSEPPPRCPPDCDDPTM